MAMLHLTMMSLKSIFKSWGVKDLKLGSQNVRKKKRWPARALWLLTTRLRLSLRVFDQSFSFKFIWYFQCAKGSKTFRNSLSKNIGWCLWLVNDPNPVTRLLFSKEGKPKTSLFIFISSSFLKFDSDTNPQIRRAPFAERAKSSLTGLCYSPTDCQSVTSSTDLLSPALTYSWAHNHWNSPHFF